VPADVSERDGGELAFNLGWDHWRAPPRRLSVEGILRQPARRCRVSSATRWILATFWREVGLSKAAPCLSLTLKSSPLPDLVGVG
jgi:hypothetical protein